MSETKWDWIGQTGRRDGSRGPIPCARSVDPRLPSRRLTPLRSFIGAGVILAAGIVTPTFAAAPPTIPADVKGRDGVKAYLVTVVESCNTAAADLQAAATAYAGIVQKNGGTPVAAAKAKPAEVADKIKALRDAYQRMDSYGYEYVEGIVAGVPSLMHFDVELDSGLPKSEAASPTDAIADVVIKAGPDTLDHEGSLNNYLVEPTVFGTNEKFIAGTATLPGFDKPVGLPKPQLIVALGAYAVDGYGRLLKDSQAWQPTDKDCFQAVYNMTPTLADYFDEWKETKKTGSAPGGRFVAVSRVSDMRGIMSSVQLTYDALQKDVAAKDPALAESMSRGYAQIIKFIDTVDARDQKKPLNVETIDALGSQAKEKADKLTVQSAQAAALMGVNVDSK